MGNITIAPSSVIMSLYSLANFTCEGTGDVLFWTIEGSSLGNFIKQQYRERDISNY